MNLKLNDMINRKRWYGKGEMQDFTFGLLYLNTTSSLSCDCGAKRKQWFHWGNRPPTNDLSGEKDTHSEFCKQSLNESIHLESLVISRVVCLHLSFCLTAVQVEPYQRWHSVTKQDFMPPSFLQVHLPHLSKRRDVTFNNLSDSAVWFCASVWGHWGKARPTQLFLKRNRLHSRGHCSLGLSSELWLPPSLLYLFESLTFSFHPSAPLDLPSSLTPD